MGGKRKQAQRTKNNTRPSNSGRTAELLGTNLPQFVGFSLTTSPKMLDDTDPTIMSNTNFQLVFKKMQKKDAITKLKALQEFAQLINDTPLDIVKTGLTFWTRFYGILATDCDHRVREAAHLAQLQMVLKDKKFIAPHLKQLIGPWFTGQYDTYAPAATAATKAFHTTFAPNKIEGVIVFCQEEIYNYIHDNLILQTPQTVCNTKTVTPEECEAKYERIIISCLQGYRLYLEKIPEEHLKKMEESHRAIVKNGKFWKFSKASSPQIRGSWYALLTLICQKLPHLMEDQNELIINTVFTGLNDNDPIVLPNIWETILIIMVSIKNWWTFINLDKIFWPKLWKMLQNGGQGNATVIYPNLLPLISRLPPTIDKNTFFQLFFENLRNGLNQKNVQTSRSEMIAISTVLIECLQYVIMKNQSNLELCKTLIDNQLIGTIEWCCLTTNQCCYKTLFNQITGLVQYWCKNIDENQFYQIYLDYFWKKLDQLFDNLIKRFDMIFDKMVVADVAQKQIDLIQSLKHNVKTKKRMRVKFSNDSDQSDEPNRSDSTRINPMSIHEDFNYNLSLNQLIDILKSGYIAFIDRKSSCEVLDCLVSLIEKNVDLFRQDLEMFDFYENHLKLWLKNDRLQTKCLIDLIFMLFKYFDDQQKFEILNSFFKIDKCLIWCITNAFSYPHNEDVIVKKWLLNEQINDYLLRIVDKELEDECPPELDVLFRLAFRENGCGELLVSEMAIRKILEKFSYALTHPDNYKLTIDSNASLASYLATIIYTETFLLHYNDQLLLALFQLTCQNDHLIGEYITVETVWEMNTTWQDIITILLKNLEKSQFLELTGKFADTIEQQFEENDDYFVNLVENVTKFLRIIQNNHPYILDDVCKIFLNRPHFEQMQNDIVKICVYYEYLDGGLSAPYEELDTNEPQTDFTKYFNWSSFKLAVLSGNIQDDLEKNYEDDEEEEEEEENLLKISLIDCTTDGTFLLELIYDLTLSKSFLNHYQITKYYGNIQKSSDYIQDNLTKLIADSSLDVECLLEPLLLAKITDQSWLWCRTLFLFYVDMKKCKPCEIYEKFMKIVDRNNLTRLHLTQVFGVYLNYDYLPRLHTTIESVILLRSLIRCDEIDVQIAVVFGLIEKLRNDNTSMFLCETLPNDWCKLQEIVEIIRLCADLVKYQFKNLNRRHWDFGVISLVSWASNCLKIKSTYDKIETKALIIAISTYYKNIDDIINNLKTNEPTNQFINEWDDLFLPNIHTDMVQIWLYLAEKYQQQTIVPLVHLPLLKEFGQIIDNINEKFIFKSNDGTLPKWSKFLKCCCTLLYHHEITLQLWGYKMLHKLLPGLIEIDTNAVINNTPNAKGLIFEQFKDVLLKCQDILDVMLEGFKLCETSCQVEPYTDSYTYSLAYLLIWQILLDLYESSSTELRFQYADWLKKEQLLKKFLNNLFLLFPSEILENLTDNLKSSNLVELFWKKPDLDYNLNWTSSKLEHIVCWIYGLCLAQLPALVRQWWSDSDSRIGQRIEKITSTFVTPHLCCQELQNVAQHENKFKNMTIKVVQNVREVIAIYTVDEAQMELVITLPSNYPLGCPDVQCNKQIGGTLHKQWLIQLRKCIYHQNGRIWDGLSLWNKNLDKKFDGVEECNICFAVLHTGTYQFPKLSCQICKKKFHSACLYKWFSTSNKSSCPICRNLF